MNIVDEILNEALYVNDNGSISEEPKGKSTNIVRSVSQEEYNEKFSDLPDTRDKVRVGDLCFGLWHGNDCCIFVAEPVTEDLDELSDDETGIGVYDEDTVGDIGYAHHVVLLAKKGQF